MSDRAGDGGSPTVGGGFTAGRAGLDDERPPIRVDLLTSRLEVEPGEEVTANLQVVNTSNLIEKVTVELVGLMADSVQILPAELTMFPHESADVRVLLRFHRALPSGEHEGLILVSGMSGRMAPAMVPLKIWVPPHPAFVIEAEPPMKTSGKKARFVVLVSNRGNTPLTLQLRAVDANRSLSLRLDEATVELPVEQTRSVGLLAKGKRPWTGTPLEHDITVEVKTDQLLETADLHLRQKPKLGAGLITLMTLLFVVGLWAAAMYFGVAQALAPPEPTKIIPESFPAGVGVAQLDPANVGGAVTGTVVAASTGKPVARVTVEAFNTRGELVSATATGDDGAYELTGLLPVRHRLRMSADGFEGQWFAAPGSGLDASELLASPSEPTSGVNVSLVGLSGSMGGTVIAGDGDSVPITVTVEANDVLGQFTRERSTTSDGTWVIDGLPAPATYTITYRAENYALVQVVQPLDAGQQISVNTARLPAASGAITGVVQDRDGNAIGGVEIVAQRGDTSLAFTTPTSGDSAVGSFEFIGLETPGTYLLTFAAEGYANETRAVPLTAGQQLADVVISLGPATGTITGTVRTPNGQPLGEVTVVVSGNGVRIEGETVNAGDAEAGQFRLAGLPLPGEYTVTFDKAGRGRETVRVVLTTDDPTRAGLSVRLAETLVQFKGYVIDSDDIDPATGSARRLGGVTLELSDGENVRQTTSNSEPGSRRGDFQFGGLEPGSYTLTATRSNGVRLIVQIEVEADRASTELEKVDFGGRS